MTCCFPLTRSTVTAENGVPKSSTWRSPSVPDLSRFHIIWSDKPISGTFDQDPNKSNWWAAEVDGLNALLTKRGKDPLVRVSREDWDVEQEEKTGSVTTGPVDRQLFAAWLRSPFLAF